MPRDTHAGYTECCRKFAAPPVTPACINWRRFEETGEGRGAMHTDSGYSRQPFRNGSNSFLALRDRLLLAAFLTAVSESIRVVDVLSTIVAVGNRVGQSRRDS